MMNAKAIALRREYLALIAVADGLMAMVRRHLACNARALVRMAAEARSAAQTLCSMIERLINGSLPSRSHDLQRPHDLKPRALVRQPQSPRRSPCMSTRPNIGAE